MDDISTQLIDGINIIVKKAVKEADYARIRTGLIKGINNDGTYNVSVDNQLIPRIPFMGSGTLGTNTTVRVAIPDNQLTQAVILGTSTGGSIPSGVTSVNGMTGDVSLNASSVGALPDTTIIPSKTSQLTNDSGYLTSIPSEYVTDTEMISYAQPKGDYATNTALNSGLNTKLSLTGGTLSGSINMGGNYINNLAPATTNNQAVTFKQLTDAIDGLGSVFELKGSVATVADLPATGNKVGDVWYVESESVGYIWLQDTGGVLRWEKFGEPIDLSAYLAKADLLQTTGTVTNNTMSQKAITDQLGLKVDKVSGKGLSTNDFTDTNLSKLNGIQAGAEVNVNADWNATSGDAQILNKPTSLPAQGGNADTANKLTTPRTIAVGNAVTSTPTNFDGSTNISIPINSVYPNYLSSGTTLNRFYLNTHPENEGVIIPFITNDLAFLLKRGGSAVVKYNNIISGTDISPAFDGTPSYVYFTPSAGGFTELTIELSLYKNFNYSNVFYLDFGAAVWRAKSIKMSVMNSADETTWTEKLNITNNQYGNIYNYFSHREGVGFDKIQIVLGDFNHPTLFRFSCIGLIQYNSKGLSEPYVSRDGGVLYNTLYPQTDNLNDLGKTTNRWKNIFATTFTGILNGNASTATKAMQDGAGNIITTTYATKSQIPTTPGDIGLGNVPNVTTNNQTPTWTIATTLANLVSGETLTIAFGKIAKSISDLIAHIANRANPHVVTKAQVGLSNVDNTSDLNKPISTAQQTTLDAKLSLSGGTLTGGLYWKDTTALPISGANTIYFLVADSFSSGGQTRYQRIDQTTTNAANRLAIPRTIQTNLASTTATSFDGTSNITPGVTGTLQPTNGGTGQINLNASTNALINSLSIGFDTPTDADYYIVQYVSGGTTTTTYHRKAMSTLWSYVQAKISSILGLTATTYKGTSTKATQDASGNVITTTYATKTEVPKTLSALTDTTITAPVNSQILQYNGTKWINANPQSFSQLQANWNETNTASVQYIQNKPKVGNSNIVSATQPTTQQLNDIWYKEI